MTTYDHVIAAVVVRTRLYPDECTICSVVAINIYLIAHAV